MRKSNKLLEELREITSLRDTKLLEQSLLHSVYQNLSVKSTSILKTDAGKVWGKVSLSKSGLDVFEEEGLLTSQQAEIINKISSKSRKSYDRIRHDGCDYFYYHLASISKEDTILEIECKAGALDRVEENMTQSIEVFNNYYNLLVYAQTDELTGLLNRKTFNQEIKRISLFASQTIIHRDGEQREDSGENYWLGLMDIDHFKSVNDTYGHVFGDEVLILVAQALKHLTRRFDTLYRFGGEEFLVLLRADTKENARKAFERFRKAIEAYNLPQINKVTISIGAIKISGRMSTAEVLDKADKALYHSKANGRNQFHLYEDLLEAGLVEEKEAPEGEIELF